MDSDGEDSVFEEIQDDSDDFVPEVKPRAKAAVKAVTVKPKKMIQTTIGGKTAPKAASKKRPKPESDEEGEEEEEKEDDEEAMDVDGGILSITPPSAKKQKKAPAKKSSGTPLADIENDSMQVDEPTRKGKKNATETYQKLTQLEHIIKRPDTYVGSIERTEAKMWVFNKADQQMEFRPVQFVPGLYKIFDEILVNAADNSQRDESMTYLKVMIDRESGDISVENNGKGIPVEMHEKERVYVPELIFGHLLAGSNFDDNEKKTVGGRNGYGAKLTNIFSTKFTLECQDSSNGKRYKQTWTANMSRMEKPKIISNKASDFVRVTFHPDYERFGMETGIDDDLEAMLVRRVYDMAGTVKAIKVWLNGEQLKINWKSYCNLYAKSIAKERGDDTSEKAATVDFDPSPGVRWQVGFTVSDGSFQQVSFVNNIATTQGGTHVNHVVDQICDALAKEVNKRKKGHGLKPANFKNHIFVFINCLINNPAFSSQTKEQLTTKQSAFGSKCLLTDSFLKKIKQSEAITNIMHFADQKADKMLAKSDGNRRSRISNEKLTDANLAGTKHGHLCTLILTEGDSAKGLALAGRAVLDPDKIGVFPLRGKLLNVRDANLDQIMKNKEIENIKKFLGLRHKQTYTDTRSLRYGHLMIMADQDHDGSHIKGLLINFLEVQFPSLLRIPDFFQVFSTPVVKVWQGVDQKRPKKLKCFFTIPEYEEWKDRNKHELRKWQFKYLKGLGSNSNEDAQVYFKALDDHLKQFEIMEPQESELFELAFSKKKADARKEWLGNFIPGTFLDHSTKSITYENFVNRELILFSMADNLRSIPSVIDGFKPGQRKVIFSCFKRNLTRDKKVLELAGYVSEMAAYHHGDQSLHQTIIGLAQTFVGSNNINVLEPSGNFGSRLAGGSDAASARYVFTRLSPFARRIFSPLDEPNLDFQFEEGKMIEPKTYAPVIPMLLANGADGIGTGWSTTIPNYNPVELVQQLKRRMGRNEGNVDKVNLPFTPMTPWFRGWKGTAEAESQHRFRFNGLAHVHENSPNEVEITELPIRVWTDDFKAKLEEIIRGEKSPSWIKDYKEFNDHKNVHFIIQLEEKHMDSAIKEGLLERFKLTKSVATTNLVAFNSQGQIRKYEKVEDIMEEFYTYRLLMYKERKSYWLRIYDADLRKLKCMYRFVQEIINGELVVSRKKKTILVQELRDRKYEAFPPKAERKAKSTDEDLGAEESSEDEDEEMDSAINARDYDYLLTMPIYSLTMERLKKLEDQIAAKKAEFDALDMLSEQDLWCRDLDDFVDEWNKQLALDAEIASNIRKIGRRASKKIGAGVAKAAAGRKKKADDEYEPDKKARGKMTKLEPKPVAKPLAKSGDRFNETFNASQKPKAKITSLAVHDRGDGSSDDDFSLLGKKAQVLTAPKLEPAAKETSVSSGRNKRAAASKARSYLVEDDESDEDFMEIGKPKSSASKSAVLSKPAPMVRDSKEDVGNDDIRPAGRTTVTKSRTRTVEDEEDDDDDFVSAEEKSVGVVKSATVKRTSAAKSQPLYVADSDDADAGDDLIAPEKPAKANARQAVDNEDDDDDDDEDDDGDEDEDDFDFLAMSKSVEEKKPVKRTAVAKVKTIYVDDEDESDEDDVMLGDVGDMVKGIKAPLASSNGGRLSLFAMSRTDGAESALPKVVKSKPSKSTLDLESQDETNYEALAMPSPRKPSKDEGIDTFLSDDEPLPSKRGTTAKASSSQTAASKAKAATPSVVPAPAKKRGRIAGTKNKPVEEKAKPKPKPQPKPKQKQKQIALSPAALAYAAKKVKVRKITSDDDDDDDVPMEEPPSPVVPKPRAIRPSRAAAAKAKPIVIDEDEDEAEDEPDLDDDDGSDAFPDDMDSD